ncbi:MAG TPA: family 78 glycoside hydrolase catalytic domain [Terracidiphilus sp.]|nr:family 78 glycoside hydrolase catalytic domain [Terracidiphilus sp.]
MNNHWIPCCLAFAASIVPCVAQKAAALDGPVELQVDNLPLPLGVDDPAPQFSWRLHDPARGARQTAYEVFVASEPGLLDNGRKADVWDSGRIESGESLNLRYAGPALKPTTRYYWRVRVWGAAGRPYTDSKTAWWETGLMTDAAWRAQWIGYETPEEAAVRHAGAQWIANPESHELAAEKKPEQQYAYRTTIQLTKPVKFAALYATGQDSVAAWIDGTQVLRADPLPPWNQMPWKRFVRAEVTAHLKAGANTLAIESVHYVINPNGMVTDEAPPTIATLVVEYSDGTWTSFASGPDWRTAIHPPAGWQSADFDDSGWKNAVAWASATGSDAGADLGHPWIPDSVKALRHTFSVDSPVKSARLYATALGMYELFLNGKRVGDEAMAPGWTDYRECVVYQTYDVTADVKAGANAIGALLAPGWYEDSIEWYQRPNNYGMTSPALLAELRIEHADGTVQWVTTDANWQARRSSILHSEIYNGETQDARLIEPGWETAVFSAMGWKPAETIDPAPIEILAQGFEPIRVEKILAAKSLTEPKPGVYVYDLGQNLAGVEQLRVEGHAGTEVTLRFGEILNTDGTVYTENLRTATATDHFILNGKGVEEFTPQFTYHGYRYAEITGLPSKPPLDALKAVVLHTAAPLTASLSTGSAMVNQLWSNILWGQRSNFMSVPTDCPQRDERLGWMGDAEVFWRTASYNMDLAAFSRKFARDMRGTQNGTAFYGIYSPGTARQNAGWGAGWSDAGIVVPWTSWLQTGDTRIIDQNWAAMNKYLDAIAAANPDFLWKNDGGNEFGDWLSPEGKTRYALIATAYWAYDLTLMRQMARATGRTADAGKYSALFDKIRAAFDKEFVRPDGFVAGGDNSPSGFGIIKNPGAKSTGGDTQTGYVLALHMDLLPEDLRAAAAKRLADKIEANHGLLGTGFLGTPYLLEVLTQNGHADLACKLLFNTAYPSWGYMIDHGATTMWERWNGDRMLSDPTMNSFNHYAYGAVGAWLYRYAAGVDATPLDAGFHTVVLHPVFAARLSPVSFGYDSAYGPIHSDWSVKGSTAVWHVTIPANTTGWLAVSGAQAAKYKLEGVQLAQSTQATPKTLDGRSGFELAAGSYTFSVQLE